MKVKDLAPGMIVGVQDTRNIEPWTHVIQYEVVDTGAWEEQSTTPLHWFNEERQEQIIEGRASRLLNASDAIVEGARRAGLTGIPENIREADSFKSLKHSSGSRGVLAIRLDSGGGPFNRTAFEVLAPARITGPYDEVVAKVKAGREEQARHRRERDEAQQRMQQRRHALSAAAGSFLGRDVRVGTSHFSSDVSVDIDQFEALLALAEKASKAGL